MSQMEAYPVEDVYKHVDAEFYGDHERLDRVITHQRFLLLGLLTLTLSLGGTTVWLALKFGTTPVHVIRINDAGRADALAYFDDSYRPQAPEVRYFLSEWARFRYTRSRATSPIEYPRNFFFIEKNLADRLMTRDRLDSSEKSLKRFYAGEGDEIAISVRNVVVKRLSELPYQADVYLTKVFYGSPDEESRLEKWVIPVTFSLSPAQVKNELVPYNPLGLTIVQFSEYQDFNSK